MNEVIENQGSSEPESTGFSFGGDWTRRNYGRLRVFMFSTMIAVSILPVVIVATLGYTNYEDLMRKDERNQLVWQLEGSIKTVEQLVESLQSVVLFTARRDRYTELLSTSNLEELFVRIRRQFPYFADIGVIDGSGVQQAYYGPYDLQGTDYSAEAWFKEASDKGSHISFVYTGYRNVPHFSISVSNYDPVTRGLWLLRATIDAGTLQEMVDTVKTDASDDLFLIDDQGLLQTSSEYYGSTLSRFDNQISPGISYGTAANGERIFYAAGKIKGTPWSLVHVKKLYLHQDTWKEFQNKLFFIVLSSMFVAVMVILALVNLMIRTIRKADEMQVTVMQEAEHTDKLASIGRLAAGVGHEINNPLSIINQKTGLIEDLLEVTPEFEHKEVMSDCLKSINHSVGRCKAVTHRLLGFARRTHVQYEELEINEVLKETLTFLDNAMLYNRIKVELQLKEELPRVWSDRYQLQQIFLNIINNAIDAIGRDGHISILTHPVAGDIRVVIQDDGPGIDEDALPQVFDPFFTTKEVGKGTGLGLSITYGLIKKLGGDITVRSRIGQGTAFTITLPVGDTADDRTENA